MPVGAVRDPYADGLDSPTVVGDPIPPAPHGKQPVRMCVGCRERATRSELLRVVAGTDANGLPAVVPDPRRTALGRGAHLHPTSACFDLAVRRRAFGRALRVPVGLNAEPVAEHVAGQLAAEPT